jgi:hypothetical protein
MGTAKEERKIRANRRSVRLDELVGVMRAAGFLCRPRSTGHWTCVHPESKARCNFAPPHGRGEAHLLVVYVDEALRALDEHRAWQEARE